MQVEKQLVIFTMNIFFLGGKKASGMKKGKTEEKKNEKKRKTNERDAQNKCL